MENMSDNTYNTTENSIDTSHLTVEQIKELTQVITQVESDLQQVKQLLVNARQIPEPVHTVETISPEVSIFQTVTTPENTGTHPSLADLLRGEVAPVVPKPTETSLPVVNISEVSIPQHESDTVVLSPRNPIPQIVTPEVVPAPVKNTLQESVPHVSLEQVSPVSEKLPISLDALQMIEQKQTTLDYPTAHRFIAEAFYSPVSPEISSTVQVTPEIVINPNNVLFSETGVNTPGPTGNIDMSVSSTHTPKTNPVSYFNNPQQS